MIDAPALIQMLATRHSADVFVPECKDGPTQTRAHRRIDAWVLLKTWSPITTIGYEVKVSVSDWRRDNKLHDYMPLCHLLYVVAPKGVVPHQELPAGVGLMEPVGDAGRLQIRRKAARREVTLPSELMVYVLMCRAKITRETNEWHPEDRNWRTTQLRQWVEEKDSRRGLSFAVSQKIRDSFEHQQLELEAERRRHDELETIRARIVELGFDPSKPINTWQVRDRLNRLSAIIDNFTLTDIRQTAKSLTKVAEALERLKRGEVDGEEVA
jgi:hypothetical protein